MTRNNSFAGSIFLLILGIGAGLAYVLYSHSAHVASIWIGVGAFVLAQIISAALSKATFA